MKKMEGRKPRGKSGAYMEVSGPDSRGAKTGMKNIG